MCKAVLLCFAVLGFMIFPTLTASANDNKFDLPNGTHLKVDICHNVDHNGHIVPVSINSVKDLNTGHGLLVLDLTNFHFVSFIPHIGTGGHEHDFVVRVYLKKGNVETNTYVSEESCPPATTTTTQPPTTTTTAPPVTTTTVPPTTTTTAPVVTTTSTPTTAPPVVTTTTGSPSVTKGTQCVDANGNPFTTSLATCPAAIAPTAPPAPVSALPHTGSPAQTEAEFASILILLGLGAKKFATR